MFKFVYDGDGYKNELCFGFGETLTHEEVAEWFTQFLRGTGYHFDGSYVLVGEEEERVLWRYNREKAKSIFDDLAKDTDEAVGTFPVI